VIQVSSPTQGPGSPQETGYRQESVNVEGVSGDYSVFKGVQKKNRPGVFAKLLQGLSAKLKKGEAAANSSSSETEEAGPNSQEKTAKKTVSLAKNAKKPPFGMEALDGEGQEEGFFNVLMVETGSEPAEAKAESLRFTERLPEINQKSDLLSLSKSLINEAGPEKTDPAPDFQDDKALANEQAQPGRRAKSGRNAGFLNAFSREAEAEFAGDRSPQTKIAQGSGAAPNGAGREDVPAPETRARKGKEKLNIEVRDLRTAEGQRGITAMPENSASLKEAIESSLRSFSKVEIEIPVELDLQKGNAGGKSGDFSHGRTFEDALAAQLRGNLSADIVRDAAVIVRNGGEGTIRLSLRPASLGDVKIRLEMTENKITGHIIVESSEALRSFERELPVLEKAFRDSGFSETNLEMFLASENHSGGGAFGGSQERPERDFLVHALAASRYEAESDQSAVERLDALNNGGMVLSASPGRTPVNLLV
jgi:flagellar hook-length control protein FliK